MRTTLDIDDDVMAAAEGIARRERCSTGQIVSRLLRLALTRQATTGSSGQVATAPSATAGFRPFASRGAPVTNADIDRLRDVEGV